MCLHGQARAVLSATTAMLLLFCTEFHIDQAVLGFAESCRVNLHGTPDDSSKGGAGLAVELYILSRLHVTGDVGQGRSSRGMQRKL